MKETYITYVMQLEDRRMPPGCKHKSTMPPPRQMAEPVKVNATLLLTEMADGGTWATEVAEVDLAQLI